VRVVFVLGSAGDTATWGPANTDGTDGTDGADGTDNAKGATKHAPLAEVAAPVGAAEGDGSRVLVSACAAEDGSLELAVIAGHTGEPQRFTVPSA
jgi:hypothetical protein